jgi:hypothetical protein
MEPLVSPGSQRPKEGCLVRTKAVREERTNQKLTPDIIQAPRPNHTWHRYPLTFI